MLNGLRVGLLLAVTALFGCVSSNQTGSYSENIDYQEAARTRMSLGLTYLKNNNYAQAKKNLDKALSFDPRSADVHYALAYYYQLVGEISRAEEFYEESLSIAPNNGDIANSYGAFQCQNGNYEKAKTYFLKAINIRQYSNTAETYENLALCAQSQGNESDAINYLNDALKHQPMRAKTLYLLTEIYVANGQWDNAEDTLRKYERASPVSPDSLWLAFEVARGQGDWQTAKGYGDMIVAMFPDSAYVQRYLDVTRESAPKVARTAKVKAISTPQNKPVVISVEPDEEPSQTASTVSATPEAQKDKENTEIVEETPIFHIVKEGENLYRISLMHNIKMVTLQTWNNLENTGAIFAGKKLWLVPPSMQED
jgi:type IV pilus assembly protein PilF